MSTVIIIPARLDSSRLPRKLLLEVAGKPILRWTFDAAMQANIGEVFVATEDDEIEHAVSNWGGRVLRSKHRHFNGTSRVIEASEQLPAWVDIVVNMQGDEPAANPLWIRSLVNGMQYSDGEIATLVSDFATVKDLAKPNVVKAVVENGMAHWFTRAPWPHSKRHIGIYAFRRWAFRSGRLLHRSQLADAERLEQLAWIVNGLRIAAVEVEGDKHLSIDTPEDLEAFRKSFE